MTPLQQALRLIDLGYSPVPIAAKKPLVPWREYQFRSVTPAEAVEWWNGERGRFRDADGMAVLTGWNHNLIVIDTDTPEAEMLAAEMLPTTPRVVITRRGKHRHYRHPGVEIPSKPVTIEGHGTRAVFDVKGDRGMCTAPGTRHPSGIIYRATRAWSSSDVLPALPMWLAKLATPKYEAPAERSGFSSKSSIERLGQYLRKHPLPPEGSGSDRATFNACVFALEVDCTDDDAVDLIASTAGFDARWVATKMRAARRFKRS